MPASEMRPEDSASRRTAEWSELSSRGTDTTIVVFPISRTLGGEQQRKGQWRQFGCPCVSLLPAANHSNSRSTRRGGILVNVDQPLQRGKTHSFARDNDTRLACLLRYDREGRLIVWVRRSGLDRAFFPAVQQWQKGLLPSLSPQTRCRGLAASTSLFSRHLRKWFGAFFCFLSFGGAAVAPAQAHARVHKGGDGLNVNMYPRQGCSTRHGAITISTKKTIEGRGVCYHCWHR